MQGSFDRIQVSGITLLVCSDMLHSDMYVCMHTCMHSYKHTFLTYTRIHTQTHIPIFLRTHARTHINKIFYYSIDISCKSFFTKGPLIIGLFCGKWPIKIRHSMDLHHVKTHYWHFNVVAKVGGKSLCMCTCIHIMCKNVHIYRLAWQCLQIR